VPDFSIYTASAAHSQYLDAGKVHRIDAAFRWVHPDERLASAKMTSFGGLYSVRGYEEDEIVADGGMLFRAEYEFDLISYFNPQRADQGHSQSHAPGAEQSWLRRLALVSFADVGRAEFKSPMAGEHRIVELGSFGWGLKAEIMENLNVGVYYGIPLRSTERTKKGDGKPYLGLVYHKQF
jgi:hemolysin activation/secretion protein